MLNNTTNFAEELNSTNQLSSSIHHTSANIDRTQLNCERRDNYNLINNAYCNFDGSLTTDVAGNQSRDRKYF